MDWNPLMYQPTSSNQPMAPGWALGPNGQQYRTGGNPLSWSDLIGSVAAMAGASGPSSAPMRVAPNGTQYRAGGSPGEWGNWVRSLSPAQQQPVPQPPQQAAPLPRPDGNGWAIGPNGQQYRTAPQTMPQLFASMGSDFTDPSMLTGPMQTGPNGQQYATGPGRRSLVDFAQQLWQQYAAGAQ